MFISILFIIIIIILIYSVKSKNDNLKPEKSTIDFETYQVLDRHDSLKSANMIAKIKMNIRKIVKYLNNNIDKYSEKEYAILNLKKRTKNLIIIERPDDSDEYITSYTLNKGEQMVLCLRTKLLQSLHDFNIIMYVVIHELAHIASNNIGHDEEFYSNFKFLLEISIKLKIYKDTDYRYNPVNYCGMVVNEYIL